MPLQRRNGLVLRAATDAGRWDRFVREHPDGTPFHLAEFVTTLGAVFGLQAHLAEAELDGEQVGVLPLLVRHQGPVALVNHGLHISYLGPLLAPGIGPADLLPAVRRFLRPRAVLHFGVKSVRPFPAAEQAGWVVLKDYLRAVVPVDDKDEESVLRLLTSGQRTALRRAQREGLTVGPATREEIARYFTPWANQPFQQQGLPPRWPAGAHLAVHDALSASGAAHTTAVRRGSELLGLSTDLVAGRRVVAWELGLSPAGRASGAAAMLFLSGMSTARRVGAAEYDLLGVPTPGIARFKRSLGADFRTCGVGQWVSPLVPLSKRIGHLAGELGGRAVVRTA